MKVAGTRLSPYSVAYVVFEDTLMVGAFLFALSFVGAAAIGPGAIVLLLGLLLGVKAVFFLAGLYDFARLPSRASFWSRLGLGMVCVGLAAMVVGLILAPPKPFVPAFVFLLGGGIVIGRTAFETLMRSPRFRKRLLFLGVDGVAQRTAMELVQQRRRDFDLVGFLSESDEGLGWQIAHRPVLGTFKDLKRVVREERIDQVVVAVKDRRKQLPLDELLDLRLRGIEILEETRVHEEIAGKIPVQDLRPSWLIFSDGFAQTPVRLVAKRVFDVVAAIIGLMLAAPIMAVTALVIRFDSKGQVLFRQQRVGQGGTEFTLLKFRSMRPDAEASGQPQWAQKDDPRVTGFGKFMRKTRLDELPQMWNVLQGHMSFVGPRPERPFFVEQLRKRIPFYDQRHAVKPGITGWAQVRFRYGSDDSDAIEKLRHDMYYVKHQSLGFDVRILLETVKVVLNGELGR